MDATEKAEIIREASTLAGTAAVDAVKEKLGEERAELLKRHKEIEEARTAIFDVAEGLSRSLRQTAQTLNNGFTTEETVEKIKPLLDAAKQEAAKMRPGLLRQLGSWLGVATLHQSAPVSATKEQQIAGLATVLKAVGPANFAAAMMPEVAKLGQQEAETLGTAMAGLAILGIKAAHGEKVVAVETKPMKTWQKVAVATVAVAGASALGYGGYAAWEKGWFGGKKGGAKK